MASAPTSRIRAIDVLRGVTIAAMILVNAQYSAGASYHQFAHAAWHGWTFADTIFPCFLFLVGVSLTLSTASRVARGEPHSRLLAHAARRALLLFACGVVIDYLRFPARGFPFIGLQDHLQLSGVLQKISVCYLLAFLIYLSTGLRGVIAAILALNLLYLGLLFWLPVPGCGAGSLVVSCNFPGWVDQAVLDGFRWNHAAFDPDGPGTVLPATGSVLFGVLAGQILMRGGRRPREQLGWLVTGGAVLIAAGALLSLWVPINKQLWTPSFAVLMAGLAAIGLAVTIWLVEDRPGLQRAYRPLEILGQNAVAAYLVSRLVANVPRVHVLGKSLHDDVLAEIANPPMASMLFAILVLVGVFIVIFVMDRRHWHLKF